MPKKTILEQLSGVESCIASRQVKKIITGGVTSKVSQKEMLFSLAAFIEDIEDVSAETIEKQNKKIIKKVLKWLDDADKKCSKQLVKQGFKTEKEQKEYIDIQMIYQNKNPLAL